MPHYISVRIERIKTYQSTFDFIKEKTIIPLVQHSLVIIIAISAVATKRTEGV